MWGGHRRTRTKRATRISHSVDWMFRDGESCVERGTSSETLRWITLVIEGAGALGENLRCLPEAKRQKTLFSFETKTTRCTPHCGWKLVLKHEREIKIWNKNFSPCRAKAVRQDVIASTSLLWNIHKHSVFSFGLLCVESSKILISWFLSFHLSNGVFVIVWSRSSWSEDGDIRSRQLPYVGRRQDGGACVHHYRHHWWSPWQRLGDLPLRVLQVFTHGHEQLLSWTSLRATWLSPSWT